MLWLGGDGEVVRWALIGGFGTLAALLGFLWGFVNVMTIVTMPRTWWLIKRGGGDPWFEPFYLHPFNDDPPEVRYQELSREKLRGRRDELASCSHFCHGNLKMTPKDATRGIDDPEHHLRCLMGLGVFLFILAILVLASLQYQIDLDLSEQEDYEGMEEEPTMTNRYICPLSPRVPPAPRCRGRGWVREALVQIERKQHACRGNRKKSHGEEDRRRGAGGVGQTGG